MTTAKNENAWCGKKKLDAFHVFSECSGLWKFRTQQFAQLVNRLRRNPKTEKIVKLLDDRIKYETEKFEGENDPEEKMQEIYPIETSEGKFDTQNHRFVIQLFRVFGKEFGVEKSTMNVVCQFLVRFIHKIIDDYNKMSQDD